MPDVTETELPGLGVRHEFSTESGERVGVISRKGGRRELVVYDLDDPDICRTVMHLSPQDTRTMAELLGATRVSEVLTAVQHQIEGLTIDWLRLPATSTLVGHTIADSRIRTRTGVSIVAVVRDADTFPAPEPDFELRGGDVAVVVGTSEGVEALHTLIAA